VLDVDRWLDMIEPRQFDEWMAYEQLEGDPDERLREILRNGLAAIATACGMGAAQITPEMLDRKYKPEESKQDAKPWTPLEVAKAMRAT
jgi:hypothetical protein